MTAVARMTMLHLRTVAPYRTQGLLVFGVIVLIDSRSQVGLVPALALLLAPLVAAQPFMVAEKSDLQTLYAVLPLRRRTVVLGHYAWALISFLAIVGWMWKTRDRDMANIQPREEMRRMFNLLAWILVYGVAIYWGASFFTEQDGTWHMTVIRDTDFTPSHIIEFYMSYPMYILVGVGGFMYARTRLPTFGLKGWSIAYTLLFVGPFMIFPNVGLNEWGHTFWFMEELFVAPLHWMFVFFGWFSLAVFGVSLQILGRVQELCKGYESLLEIEPAE